MFFHCCVVALISSSIFYRFWDPLGLKHRSKIDQKSIQKYINKLEGSTNPVKYIAFFMMLSKYAMLQYAVLCYAMLQYAVLCYAMLQYAVLFNRFLPGSTAGSTAHIYIYIYRFSQAFPRTHATPIQNS